MELLYNFGFEPILFVAQIVNFLIIFFIMKRFLYKPLIKTLDERKHKTSEGLRYAEEADKRLQETIMKEEQIMKKAQEGARKLMDEAKIEQEAMIQKAEETTQTRVNKMLTDARKQIEFETSEAEKRLSSHVSTLAIQFLQEATQNLFTPEEQEMVMKNAIKKLKKKAD